MKIFTTTWFVWLCVVGTADAWLPTMSCCCRRRTIQYSYNGDSPLNGQSQESSSSSENDSSSSQNPTLVDKETFVQAVEYLKEQFAQQSGVPYQEDPLPEGVTPDQIGYAIGRLQVTLPIAPTPPGLDLTDSDGLVLVSFVSDQTYQDTGMERFDTIVSVGVNNGNEQQQQTSILGASFETTIRTIQAATQIAMENGQTTIDLELNRLMKGYYGAPS